jgi:hypothetical protein
MFQPFLTSFRPDIQKSKRKNVIPSRLDMLYADFAAEFRAELYGKFTRIKYCFLLSHCHLILDPNEWADIFAASGAKYVTNISL